MNITFTPLVSCYLNHFVILQMLWGFFFSEYAMYFFETLISVTFAVLDMYNFLCVEDIFSFTKLHLLFLTETQMSEATDRRPFSVPSYFLYRNWLNWMLRLCAQRLDLLPCPHPWIFRVFRYLASTPDSLFNWIYLYFYEIRRSETSLSVFIISNC